MNTYFKDITLSYISIPHELQDGRIVKKIFPKIEFNDINKYQDLPEPNNNDNNEAVLNRVILEKITIYNKGFLDVTYNSNTLLDIILTNLSYIVTNNSYAYYINDNQYINEQWNMGSVNVFSNIPASKLLEVRKPNGNFMFSNNNGEIDTNEYYAFIHRFHNINDWFDISQDKPNYLIDSNVDLENYIYIYRIYGGQSQSKFIVVNLNNVQSITIDHDALRLDKTNYTFNKKTYVKGIPVHLNDLTYKNKLDGNKNLSKFNSLYYNIKLLNEKYDILNNSIADSYKNITNTIKYFN